MAQMFLGFYFTITRSWTYCIYASEESNLIDTGEIANTNIIPSIVAAHAI